MTLHRLHNNDWGIETNCFVCEPSNDAGLQIPFFHDDERRVVTADFELPSGFSGAPTLVHGGVSLAILDEAMAWACIAIGRQWAVTTESTAQFHRAVRIGAAYSVVAEVVEQSADTIRTTARILDRHDNVRVAADATFTILGQAQAARLAGADLTDVQRALVQDAGTQGSGP